MVNDKAMGYTQLQSRSDEELCACAASGEPRGRGGPCPSGTTALCAACARPYFLAGGDSEDLLQEGMLGLLKAIREYDPGRDAAFRTFAETCIRNRLLHGAASAAYAREAYAAQPIRSPCIPAFFDGAYLPPFAQVDPGGLAD